MPIKEILIFNETNIESIVICSERFRNHAIYRHLNKYFIRQESSFVFFCIINYRISEKQKTDERKRNENLYMFHLFS